MNRIPTVNISKINYKNQRDGLSLMHNQFEFNNINKSLYLGIPNIKKQLWVKETDNLNLKLSLNKIVQMDFHYF